MPTPVQEPTSSDGVVHTIHEDGSQTWHKDGVKHRDSDLPAEIDPDGTQRWYRNGFRHREGDLPAVQSPDGTQQWYKNGERHRENGPALVSPTLGQMWYQHGQHHREDGPAIIGPTGTEHGWYHNGKPILPPEPDKSTPLEVKLGTNKLRQLRDHIEARGGLVGRKDLPAQLPDEIKPLLTPRGELSSKKIQDFLDSKPGLKFGVTEDEWNGPQRHNNRPSDVMQLNVTPEQRQQLKDAGVHDTFESMMEASRQSHHPVGRNTVGWVRYTMPDSEKEVRREAEEEYLGYPKDSPHIQKLVQDRLKKPSIFMDEVQSDFGQSFGKQVAAQAHQEALNAIDSGEAAEALDENGDMAGVDKWSSPEKKQAYIDQHVARARAEAEQKWPEAHQQKINEILFGGRHPNEVLHEAFHEHMRQRGHVGTPISIWTPESKAPQSDMDPDKPLPGHMKLTYGDVPKKMGMQRSLYGIPAHADTEEPLRPAESGEHHSQPVWADVIRKREPQLKHIAALAVVNPRGELLFQKRRDNGKWTNPAGHLDANESPEAGARRELLEETNLVPHRCQYLGSGSPQGKNIVVHCYRAHVDGIPSAKNDPDKEASEFRWVDTSKGLTEEIADNLHSPDNVLLKLLGLQNDALAKGAMQRLQPFRPTEKISGGYKHTSDVKNIRDWQGTPNFEDRENLPRLEGPGRERALHKLHAATAVRRGDNGERQFLLHRMIGHDEGTKTVRGDNVVNVNHSSWTPTPMAAAKFNRLNGRLLSAWIPESKIHTVPKQLGRLGLWSPYQGKITPGGQNEYSPEYEVVVSPHSSAIHKQFPSDMLSHMTGEDLDNVIGKSEDLAKAPASWNEPPARLEEFAHDNLGPQSSRFVHAGTHQLSPSAWVHKYEEPKAFKLGPGSTRKLTEYRITNSREPSHERALAILGGTAHDDNGVKKFRVSSFAVHPRARRHGIGKVLYEHVLRDNGGRTESDTMVSPSAQGFYEGLARDKRFRVKFGDDTADTRHGVELSKSLKNSFMALATVAGMAAPGVVNAHEPKLAPVTYHHEENMSPAPARQKWGPEGLAPELFPIAHLESNMGQNMDHAKHSKGEFHTALGALGMKPITAFERYHHEPHLQQLFPDVGDDKDKFLTELKANPLFYNAVASAEFNHNKKVFGGDIHRAVFSWRWGLQAAHDAPAENVIADPYVTTFDKLNNRLKSRQELAKSTGVRVEHYSNVPGLQELKPRFQGTGYTGAEKNRPDRVPRVYVYRAGTKPEGDIGTLPHKYSGALDPAINLYDMGKDALGLLKPRQRQTSYGVTPEPVDLSAVERKIKRLGFHGYSNYNPRIPHAIAVFKPVRVKQES